MIQASNFPGTLCSLLFGCLSSYLLLCPRFLLLASSFLSRRVELWAQDSFRPDGLCPRQRRRLLLPWLAVLLPYNWFVFSLVIALLGRQTWAHQMHVPPDHTSLLICAEPSAKCKAL